MKRLAIHADEARDVLTQLLLTGDPGPDKIRDLTSDIGCSLLRLSPYINKPNFTRIYHTDIYCLFEAYDSRFLDGLCMKLLGPRSIRFRLSKRMTRAGGKTSRVRQADGTTRYEIAISISILYDGFQDGDPEVTVGGLPCANRLEALQRLFEHELVHLVELLCWDTSSCKRERFQGIARRFFGHRDHTHQLLTRKERAAKLGITPGLMVSFEFQGQWLTGRVNRITKRATVLVRSPAGERFSDGNRYATYYVYLQNLRPAEAARDKPTTKRLISTENG